MEMTRTGQYAIDWRRGGSPCQNDFSVINLGQDGIVSIAPLRFLRKSNGRIGHVRDQDEPSLSILTSLP